jgi:hypothetical protein
VIVALFHERDEADAGDEMMAMLLGHHATPFTATFGEICPKCYNTHG